MCGATPWLASEHAEIAALRLAGDVTGATAYVARVGADGRWRHAQPCLRCRYRFDRVGVHTVWTSDDNYVRFAAVRRAATGRGT